MRARRGGGGWGEIGFVVVVVVSRVLGTLLLVYLFGRVGGGLWLLFL